MQMLQTKTEEVSTTCVETMPRRRVGHRRTQSQFELAIKARPEDIDSGEVDFQAMLNIHQPLNATTTQEALQATTNQLQDKDKEVIIDTLDISLTELAASKRVGFINSFRNKTFAQTLTPHHMKNYGEDIAVIEEEAQNLESDYQNVPEVKESFEKTTKRKTKGRTKSSLIASAASEESDRSKSQLESGVKRRPERKDRPKSTLIGSSSVEESFLSSGQKPRESVGSRGPPTAEKETKIGRIHSNISKIAGATAGKPGESKRFSEYLEKKKAAVRREETQDERPFTTSLSTQGPREERRAQTLSDAKLFKLESDMRLKIISLQRQNQELYLKVDQIKSENASYKKVTSFVFLSCNLPCG
eukprot:TRINITY_DN2177_c0_g1_i7.p1 TRINITY_DN2177_c0_g1~~TRINITY_DN2177_c0_g1_i7.p1  ORF type:complete len:359 (-),score=68.00 TRINITY_DN2177_c0_g1_i7:400-1476(-)